MEPDTFRSDVGGSTDTAVESADVYWRRRVAVLTGVLVVVAVVAWACTSATGNREEGLGGQAGQGESGPLVVSLPPGLATASASDEASQEASEEAGDEPAGSTPGLSPGAPPSPGALIAPPGDSPKGAARRPGDPCDPRDLVIGLRGGQEVYAGDARPSFLLTVVSTGRMECAVDVGPRTLEMRITSGQDRIWSTADCVSGDGVDMTMLERGIPYVRTIQWDRHRSGDDCAGRRPGADTGTYIAYAHAGQLKSPRVVFHLR